MSKVLRFEKTDSLFAVSGRLFEAKTLDLPTTFKLEETELIFPVSKVSVKKSIKTSCFKIIGCSDQGIGEHDFYFYPRLSTAAYYIQLGQAVSGTLMLLRNHDGKTKTPCSINDFDDIAFGHVVSLERGYM